MLISQGGTWKNVAEVMNHITGALARGDLDLASTVGIIRVIPGLRATRLDPIAALRSE